MEDVRTDSILYTVKFSKPGTILHAKIATKVAKLLSKVEERKKRIEKIRSEYEITDADMVELMRAQQSQRGARVYTYSSQLVEPTKGTVIATTKEIPAGVVANMEAEEFAMKQEKAQEQRLSLISRNMNVALDHEVSFEDLQYLGF